MAMLTSGLRRAAVLAALVATTAAFGSPAHASTETPVETMGTAPTCVHLSTDKPGIVTKTVRVTNNCSYTVRVRVDISFNPDLPCNSMNPGQRLSWKIPRGWIVAGVNNR